MMRAGQHIRSICGVVAISLAVFLWAVSGAHAEDTPAWMEYNGYDTSSVIKNDSTHLSTDELTHWANDRVVEALSFHPFSYAADYDALRPFFTETGWIEYEQYIKEVKIPEMINDKKLTLTTVLERDFRIIDKTKIDGYLGWSMEAPLLLSFYDTYSDESDTEKRMVVSAIVPLRLMLKRVEDGMDNHNIAIHRWSAGEAE